MKKKERVMKKQRRFWMVLVTVVALTTVGFGGVVAAEEETAPQAGEKTGVEGQFVRVAETSEGFVVLGYRIANESVNQEWMLLDVGMTVQRGVKSQKITRDQIKLVTPDKQVIPLATQEEYEKARGLIAAMEKRDAMTGDSIDYFPPGVINPCRIGFFADPARLHMELAYDQVELSSTNACVGQLYFHVPGGIQYGNYNLDVVFANSIVKVPMKIMTKQEAQDFEKKWKEELKESRHNGHDHK